MEPIQPPAEGQAYADAADTQTRAAEAFRILLAQLRQINRAPNRSNGSGAQITKPPEAPDGISDDTR